MTNVQINRSSIKDSTLTTTLKGEHVYTFAVVLVVHTDSKIFENPSHWYQLCNNRWIWTRSDLFQMTFADISFLANKPILTFFSMFLQSIQWEHFNNVFINVEMLQASDVPCMRVIRSVISNCLFFRLTCWTSNMLFNDKKNFPIPMESSKSKWIPANWKTRLKSSS